MTKTANILDPTLSNILNRYGVKLASSRCGSGAPHVGTEPPMHGGGHVDSELANDDEDTGCAEPKGPLTKQDNSILHNYIEGGIGTNDLEHRKLNGHTPSGEETSFGHLLSGEGERPSYTKKTKDPGYHHSQPDPELSTGGKEAAFLESAGRFAEVQNMFVNDIAFIAKTASEEPIQEGELDPEGAVQGMLGPGAGATAGAANGGEAGGALPPAGLPAGGEEAGGELDGEGDEELSPEEVEKIMQIMQQYEGEGGGAGEGGEDEELTPEELEIVQHILEQAEGGQGGEGADIGDGEELGDGEEDQGEELSPEEIAQAQGILQQQSPGGEPGGLEQKLGSEKTAGDLTQDEIEYAKEIVEAATKLAGTSEYEEPNQKDSFNEALEGIESELPVTEKIAKLQAKNAQQAARANRFGRTIDDLIGRR